MADYCKLPVISREKWLQGKCLIKGWSFRFSGLYHLTRRSSVINLYWKVIREVASLEYWFQLRLFFIFPQRVFLILSKPPLVSAFVIFWTINQRIVNMLNKIRLLFCNMPFQHSTRPSFSITINTSQWGGFAPPYLLTRKFEWRQTLGNFEIRFIVWREASSS